MKVDVTIIRKCLFCEGGYEVKQRHQQYCSGICRKRANQSRHRERDRVRAKEWYKRNREKVRTVRKAYYLAHQKDFKVPDEQRKKMCEYYYKNREKYLERCRKYRESNKARIAKKDKEYKDKVRHGGIRANLLEKQGYRCSQCGKETDSFSLVLHHSIEDSHTSQVLLCRACHCKLHKPHVGS